MTIKLMRDAAFAPCCFIIARQRDDGTYDARDEANTILIQTDWDWSGIAETFGWSMASHDFGRAPDCDHSGTDGTVDCPDCGIAAHEFIAAAGEWLRENVGATADDPGYFEETTR